MGDQPEADERSIPTTEHALRLFSPGQRLSIKPLDGPESTFTISKLFTPITISVVILAEADAEPFEEVVIKLYDPRYLAERINAKKPSRSRPWKLEHEQAAVAARSINAELDDDRLQHHIDAVSPKRLRKFTAERQVAQCVLWEERYYRYLMKSYSAEARAYERLKDLQGSTVLQVFMTGYLIPPDERAIQPPAIVFEYLPSVTAGQATPSMVHPDIFAPVIEAVDTFDSRGIIHTDMHLRNILFSPPEKPTRAVLIDFGCAAFREEETDGVAGDYRMLVGSKVDQEGIRAIYACKKEGKRKLRSTRSGVVHTRCNPGAGWLDYFSK